MGFDGGLSSIGLMKAFVLTMPLPYLVRVGKMAHELIFVSCIYLFFIPTAVYISLSESGLKNEIAYVVSVLLIFLSTQIKFELPKIFELDKNIFIYSIFSLILIAIGSQAYFGGLSNFSLDIERVYEFRRETAENLPTIFAYVYSNVASVLLPFMLVVSFIRKNYYHFFATIIFTIILFGMSHHKSVLFGPPAALLLYIAFSNSKLFRFFPIIFILIPAISIIEIFYVKIFGDFDDIAYITSLIVRRVLFVPAMLDAKYIEFFSSNPYFYWSSSRLFSWAINSGYNLAAPFLIGYEYFSDLDTSANTGIIGSGYSNAGIYGVAIYSSLCGILLSFFRAIGNKIGHEFAASVSFIAFFNVISSTDLLTAFLTHGLLLLIIVLFLSSSDLSSPKYKEIT
jgi:hypothetical protein